MTPLPICSSAVVIDRLVPADGESLSLSHSDPENARFQGWPSPLSLADALRFIASMKDVPLLAVGSGAQLAIRELPEGPLVGDLYIARRESMTDTIELGITLLRQHQGRGLATAAIRAFLRAVRGTQGIQRLEAIIDVDNVRSIALFERLAFGFERRLAGTHVRRDGSTADELNRFVG